MEDGVKKDPAQCKEPKFLGKAGWVKKAPGRLLASYKDRYIRVEKTEIAVYENEDLQNCLERLDLENYDKCHELKSTFKKRHRLILIRTAKSGNKVHDVKFQVQTAEEKEAWIKALADGINRAKNKVFDEVKVDNSSNLEHVTRTRPKANRNRRPPTRIHMKEVAGMSSDGILRLDLDLEDAIMPNGTHCVNVDGTETSKETIKVATPVSNASEAAEKQSGPSDKAEKGAQSEPEVSPQKKVIKPPMPPTKEAKPVSAPENEPDKEDEPQKKVLKPPMPPSKEAKSCISPTEEVSEEATVEETSEKGPDATKKTGPPPTPPNKPSLHNSLSNLAEASQSMPPTPPSKEKKPSHPAVAPDQEVQGTAEDTEEEEDSRKETTGTAMETDEMDPSMSGHESPSTEVQVCEEEKGDTISTPCPLLTSKKKPENQPIERQDHTASPQTSSDTSDNSIQAEEGLPKSEVLSVSVSLNDPLTDSRQEEKYVDSGQQSGDNSEGSDNEDTLAASTVAFRGSHADLDVLDASEDNNEISVSLRPTQAATKSQVRSKVCPPSKPTTPVKPSAKARSASIGDLLTDSSGCIQERQHARDVAGSDRSSADGVIQLETEVALEKEKTSQLMRTASQSQGGGNKEGMPEDLLAKAMDRLEKAEHVLRQVKKLKLTSNNRKSW
ncbi:pleckstrin homology domain-containing family O member 2 [Toxotes jaculatrix]|uniref:pleckstrin homology domain-containing family O member 2 n=1 Tax=Toxotes jaculatrix TaxID=941984 RepID=UPI001B3AF044|nr:pleckstrin homology domain-containing family O member 2 [Toxotes jaculatrix]